MTTEPHVNANRRTTERHLHADLCPAMRPYAPKLPIAAQHP
jgi:hypothetical protein